MEFEVAVEIFARSAQARNLTCKTYVGDGESKTYSAVRDSMPYVPLIYIVKEEYKSHITKKDGNWPSQYSEKLQRYNLTYLICSNIIYLDIYIHNRLFINIFLI